jgi:glycosyltransferase involved in cell wall biosynthesis
LRILHFSKYATKGGAALAALSSVCAQRRAGVDALMYVGRGPTEDDFVMAPSGVGEMRTLANFVIERLPFRLTAKSPFDARSLGLAGLDGAGVARRLGADLVMLHNMDGLLSLSALPRFHCPVVWRTHDMWAMCGTEHYVTDSAPYRWGNENDIPDRLSRWTYRRKRRAYRRMPSLTICAPSEWLRDEMAASQLLGDREAVTIPNGIDTDAFAPVDRIEARNAFGLAHGAPVVLFGSAGGSLDPRKGFDLLVEALEHAAAPLGEMGAQLVTFGGGPVPRLAIPVHNLGRISDRSRLRMLYAAADMIVVPSRLENLSLTVLEALSCGTPTIAFRVGGMPDMIDPDKNGWLVEPFDVQELAKTIVEGLRVSASNDSMRRSCREIAVTRFDRRVEAEAMICLFERILGRADITGTTGEEQ